MIYSLPSFLRGHASENLACTRVMAGPENIRAGFMKESDVFADNGIQYASPFVNMAEPEMVPKQMYDCLKDVFDLDLAETQRAVDAGYKALARIQRKGARRNAENSDLVRARRTNRACWCWPARITWTRESGTRSKPTCRRTAIPIVWLQYLPMDDDLLDWMFRRRSAGQENPLAARHLRRVDFLQQQQHE